MKDYYVTWSEKKFRSYFNYIRTIPGNSAKEIKALMQNEQNERRRIGAPHMFSVKITRTRPGEDFLNKWDYKEGHLYF